MSIRKRNEYLEIGHSDSEDHGYSSTEVDGRAGAFRSRAKRQKVEHHSARDAESETDDADQDGVEDALQMSKPRASIPRKQTADKVDGSTLPLTRLDDEQVHIVSTLPSKRDRKRKPGVIYISRVPPFMKPSVVRNMLSQYGEVGRIFLTPEDSTLRSQRLRSGGNRRKLYTDGWVEFLSKRDAKAVAETLNAQTIGGKKRGRFHDEVWNIKYLRGLKWQHLVEQIANENAERAARMRTEIASATRENKRFLENVERAKMLEGMEAKREKKNSGEMEGQPGGVAVRRQFKQNEVRVGRAPGVSAQSEALQTVMDKIF